MATLSSGLNVNVVKTALDDVFNQEFTGDQHPGTATAETPAIFHQDTAASSAVIWEQFKGGGNWQTRQEEQDVPQLSPRVGNQKTFTILNYSGQIDISKNFFDDQMHGVYEKMVANFARRARTTRDQNAFSIFVNAFSTQLTSDAVSLINSSHINLNGDTVSNNVAAALSETTLFTAIRTLFEMKAQDGVVDGSLASALLVPPALYKLAIEITESELRSGTANNDENVYSSKYGIMVYTSPFIGTAVTGGSNTAWFVLGTNHSVYRFVRQGVQTVLQPWQDQRNNNYVYKGEFREIAGAQTYEGIVGSAT